MTTKVVSAVLLVAVLLGVALQSAAAVEAQNAVPDDRREQVSLRADNMAGNNRRLLGWKGCSRDGRWFNHWLSFGGYQCCDGSWRRGSCGDNWGYGRCQWSGQWYPNYEWAGSYQCCSGSWRPGGCSGSGSGGQRCQWEGRWYDSWSWNSRGYQCCYGSWRSGGCSRS